MRDFPIFETQFGVASLILRDVPYWQKAYIKVLSSLEPEKLLKECVDFCKMVGADDIFVSGDRYAEQYPRYATLVKMEVKRTTLPPTNARAVKVTEDTFADWKRIYNDKMKQVPNASHMDDSQSKELTESGYYIYEGDRLLGIGKAKDATIEAVASVCPGRGQDAVCALAEVLNTDTISLLVARENVRAYSLYQRLGFAVTEEVSIWYQIL